jgi:hypothetical protein
MPVLTLRLILFSLLLSGVVFAQDTSNTQSAFSSCTFQDGNQLTVRYSNVAPDKKRDLPLGKVWSPGDVPMLLFTESPLTVGNVAVPVGAYSMYVIPDKTKWTLIVSKNVTAGSAYDEKQDLVRVPMETGKLSLAAEQPQVSFGHIAPKVCSLRVDYAKTGAWADSFVQK